MLCANKDRWLWWICTHTYMTDGDPDKPIQNMILWYIKYRKLKDSEKMAEARRSLWSFLHRPLSLKQTNNTLLTGALPRSRGKEHLYLWRQGILRRFLTTRPCLVFPSLVHLPHIPQPIRFFHYCVLFIKHSAVFSLGLHFLTKLSHVT